MPAYSFDTSALAKRDVVAVGSSWVQAIVAQQSGQTISTSVLTQPEIVSALQRRVQEGRLEVQQAQQLAQQAVRTAQVCGTNVISPMRFPKHTPNVRLL